MSAVPDADETWNREMLWRAAPVLSVDAAGAPLAEGVPTQEEAGHSGKRQGHNRQFNTVSCHTPGQAAVGWDLALIWHRHKVSACLALLRSMHRVSAATAVIGHWRLWDVQMR